MLASVINQLDSGVYDQPHSNLFFLLLPRLLPSQVGAELPAYASSKSLDTQMTHAQNSPFEKLQLGRARRAVAKARRGERRAREGAGTASSCMR
eukprot:6157812-Pleurochrysis_carterae.AAC.9